MRAFYNDSEPYVAEWLRNLITAGHITGGTVDQRSIEAIEPGDLDGFSRCHFFAGIAGWDLALQLAGWPEDCEVWTGSCPCQPYSLAGRLAGDADKRNLWPEFRRLIAERRPSTIFGEQVASRLGREWLSRVRTDLEKMGYAVGAADLCAAGAGAAHIRQRLYWVAHSTTARRCELTTRQEGAQRERRGAADLAGRPSDGVSQGEQARFKDGSLRRTQPGVDVLVDAFPGRVGACEAFGNAIVPPLAAEFVRAFMDTFT